MVDLDFLSYADVHRHVSESIAALRQFPVAAVTYVPRGGAAIAAIVCQLLDVFRQTFPFAALVELCPECHVAAFPEMIEA